ncbi:MAG: ATP-binding protein, partial [Mycobacteriales bacterium]
EVTPLVGAQQGAFFLLKDPPARLELESSYGFAGRGYGDSFGLGEGLVGQAAVDGAAIRVREVPAGFFAIRSGLGEAGPADLAVLPVLFEGNVLGVIELASLSSFSELHLNFLEQLVETIGVVLNAIMANGRTEALLEESQRLTRELQVQSEELQRANSELEDKAGLLEVRNREIEMARIGLEEKAEQLAVSSQYKSEFLANMSHELRTPLNSLLILAKLLADNQDNNLSERQIEFARTIYSAGTDLLELIDDILDLSKVEAGRMDVQPAPVAISAICDYVDSSFRPVAEEKGLRFEVVASPELPEYLVTDEKRLQQVLRNLLSNAVKFTNSGSVVLEVTVPKPEALLAVPQLAGTPSAVAFCVADTGIGIPAEKQQLIFEAFQQADGTTSRRFGGTGLGLSISREIARLLGGAITVSSEPGVGSTFTLYTPVSYSAAPQVPVRLSDAPALDHPSTQIIAGQRRELRADEGSAEPLEGITVLVIDDDVRNVFALTSALELYGMRVLYADNGAEGIELLRQHPETDLVLMDVMMPEMDGNQTAEAIRAVPEFADMPVLFLTAKAMPGDREKSLAAGASDYITKPVDLDRLLATMRSWLPRRAGTPAAEQGSGG